MAMQHNLAVQAVAADGQEMALAPLLVQVHQEKAQQAAQAIRAGPRMAVAAVAVELEVLEVLR